MAPKSKSRYLVLVAAVAVAASLDAAADSNSTNLNFGKTNFNSGSPSPSPNSGNGNYNYNYNTGNQMTITQIGVVNTAVGAQSVGGNSTISASSPFVDLSSLESITMLMSSIYGNVDVSDAQITSGSGSQWQCKGGKSCP